MGIEIYALNFTNYESSVINCIGNVNATDIDQLCETANSTFAVRETLSNLALQSKLLTQPEPSLTLNSKVWNCYPNVLLPRPYNTA